MSSYNTHVHSVVKRQSKLYVSYNPLPHVTHTFRDILDTFERLGFDLRSRVLVTDLNPQLPDIFGAVPEALVHI